MKRVNRKLVIAISLYCLSTLLSISAQEPDKVSESKAFNSELFLGEEVKEYAQSEERHDFVSPNHASREGIGNSETVALSKGVLKTITMLIAEDLEKNFFSKSEFFWPSWDTSKDQILLINQSADVAYLLNNQATQLDDAGARIEYSARTLHNNDIKVNQFGLTHINGLKTYFYNVDAYTQFGEQVYIDEVYQIHLSTIVHEATHLLAQTDTKSVDQVEYGAATRGVTFPIDISSRHYRNEVHNRLRMAAKENDKTKKVEYLQDALGFHKQYLAANPGNATHNDYDYAEGMAEYVTHAYMALSDTNETNVKKIRRMTKRRVAELASYSESDQSGRYGVLDWGREYYDIGALALAVAIDLGHDAIFNVSDSPLTYLLKNYNTNKAPQTGELKALVYAYYGKQESIYNKQKQEITRVMSDQNNMLIEFDDAGDGSMSIESESFIYDYHGEEGLFEIRSQEIKFGDNRVKLNGQHVLNLMPKYEFSEADKEFGQETISQGQGASDAFPDGDMEELIDDDFPASRLIIPVNKNHIEVNDGRLTIQTDKLVMFDVKFKKKGRVYKLIKS